MNLTGLGPTEEPDSGSQAGWVSGALPLSPPLLSVAQNGFVMPPMSPIQALPPLFERAGRENSRTWHSE